MSFAYSNKTWELVQHTSRDRGFLIVHFSTNGETYGWLYQKAQALFFYVHGYMLWIAWGVLGFWQIATMRYLKPFFKPSVWFHIISGLFILIVTLVFCILGIAKLYYTVSSHWHAYIGIFITCAVIIVPVSGFLTYYYNLKSRWSTNLYMKIRASH